MSLHRKPWFIGVLAAVLLLIVIALFARPSAFVPSELPDWQNATGWLNTPPLSWQSLAGRPTVVYFWSSTCGRCINGLPQVQSWANDSGLNVVLVHAPEFAFERDAATAAYEAQRLGISGPIALDHSSVLWSAYTANHSRDILYVVAANGSLLYSSAGADSSLDGSIRNLTQDVPVVMSALPESDSRHIHTGFATAVLGIRKDWRLFQEQDFLLPNDPDLYVPYLVGRWYVDFDSVRAVTSGYVLIRIRGASRLDAVMRSPDVVEVLESNQPLPASRMGYDLLYQDGRTSLFPSRPRLYRVAQNLSDQAEFLFKVPAGFTLYRLSLEN